MDVARLKRYKEKLDLIEKRLDEIAEWRVSFLSEEKSKLATSNRQIANPTPSHRHGGMLARFELARRIRQNVQLA